MVTIKFLSITLPVFLLFPSSASHDRKITQKLDISTYCLLSYIINFPAFSNKYRGIYSRERNGLKCIISNIFTGYSESLDISIFFLAFQAFPNNESLPNPVTRFCHCHPLPFPSISMTGYSESLDILILFFAIQAYENNKSLQYHNTGNCHPLPFLTFFSDIFDWGCPWYSGSTLDCRSTGRAIDPAPGA